MLFFDVNGYFDGILYLLFLLNILFFKGAVISLIVYPSHYLYEHPPYLLGSLAEAQRLELQ